MQGRGHARVPATGVYVPRQTHDCDAAVLVRRHLAGFIARLEESGQGPLPGFVRDELEGFGGCGDYAEPGIMRSAWANRAEGRGRGPFVDPCTTDSTRDLYTQRAHRNYAEPFRLRKGPCARPRSGTTDDGGDSESDRGADVSGLDHPADP